MREEKKKKRKSDNQKEGKNFTDQRKERFFFDNTSVAQQSREQNTGEGVRGARGDGRGKGVRGKGEENISIIKNVHQMHGCVIQGFPETITPLTSGQNSSSSSSSFDSSG